MLFQTWTFLVFFLVFYLLYRLLARTRWRLPLVLAASYVFYIGLYGDWRPLYLLLVVYSTLVDYFAVRQISRGRGRRAWLIVSLVNNLGVLAFFKYRVFAIDTLNACAETLGLGFAFDDPTPGLLLPVGISFYTFQSMSYTIDYYRGKVEAEHDLVRFAAFVALFPQLVAGPIERARKLLPQLRRPPQIDGRDLVEGLSLFVVGLFKKVALANWLGLYVDQVWAQPEQASSRTLAIATFFFAWQIYFDFSGYSDMARGIARSMGIRLSLNFRNPYTATGIGEFWRRWHITLSSWFRDYVYIALGGNRCGRVRTALNIFLTMLLSGIWHGANWTFVVWGALHGVAAVVLRPLERSAFYREQTPKILKQSFVFAFVCVTWIFFRSESLAEAWLILRKIATPSFDDALYPRLLMGAVLAVWVYQLAWESFLRPLLELRLVRVALMAALLLWLALVPSSDARPFIYFQF